MGKNIDIMSSFLLILVILGVGIFASSQSLVSSDVTTYYDFHKLDLLNVTGVNVNDSQDYNSLVFSNGFDTSNSSSDIKFQSDFGVNLTNVSEYTIEVQYDLSNINNSNLDTFSSLDSVNLSDSIINLQNNRNEITLRKGFDISTTQLTGNSDLIHGRDDLGKGILTETFRVNPNEDYILGTFDFVSDNDVANNIHYTNLIKISDEITNLVDNAKMNFGIGVGSSFETGILGNDTFSINYIKLSYTK